MKRTHSWPEPTVPTLAGEGFPVALYDSARGEIAPVAVHDGRASIYVCGITPYDATHLGHAATYVAFDTCIRALRQAGVAVDYAQNITDVDDPLFDRARDTNVDWRELGESQTNLFRSDMAALRVIPPRDYVRVQHAIDDVAQAVAALVEAGFAYSVPTPDSVGGEQDIYLDIIAVQQRTEFAVAQISHYSPVELSEKFVEFGGDPDRAGKRCMYDPLLWRAARADEPSWTTVVGTGRPGWHAECAVIALGTLADADAPSSVTIQAGGRDLKFPHHEMTVAHATALTSKPFATHFAHAGLIAYEGTKMSKSLGNLVLVSKLTAAGADPAAIRLAILAHHYRSDWEWTDAALEAATERLRNWREAALTASTEPCAETEQLVQQMRRAIADDLNTPEVTAIVDRWVQQPVRGSECIDAVDALLGIDLRGTDLR